jgi:hypothetical protein
MYEFTSLQPPVANRLAQTLGLGLPFTQPATLAEIYNHEEEAYQPQKNEIGFKR